MARTARPLVHAKVSVEDLLKFAQSEKEDSSTPEISTESDNVLSFLMAFQIKPGKDKVTGRLFYELYKKWATDPVSKVAFSLKFNMYIAPDNDARYYSVDRSGFKIGQEVEKYLLANSRPVTKSKTYKNHFEHFLKKYSLKPGKRFVEVFVLYYLYDKWTYQIKKKQPLGPVQFQSLCKLYFKNRRISSSRVAWFGVDGDGLFSNLTIKQIDNIRKGRKMRYGKSQPKKS